METSVKILDNILKHIKIFEGFKYGPETHLHLESDLESYEFMDQNFKEPFKS